MKRKVIKQGAGGFTMYLPKEWITRYSIRAGDELDVTQQGSQLVINSTQRQLVLTETLDLRNVTHLLRRVVVGKYMKGCQEIEIFYDSPSKARSIQKRVDQLIGMEVIEQNRERLLLKDIAGSTNDSSESIIKRIFFLLHSLCDELYQGVHNNDLPLELLEDLERNINKFSEYCVRLINREGSTNQQRSNVLYCFIFLLEDLGDDLKKFIHFLHSEKGSCSKVQKEMLTQVIELFKSLEKTTFKFTLKKSVALAKQYDLVTEHLEKYQRKAKKKEEVLFSVHLNTIAEKIIKLNGELLLLN